MRRMIANTTVKIGTLFAGKEIPEMKNKKISDGIYIIKAYNGYDGFTLEFPMIIKNQQGENSIATILSDSTDVGVFTLISIRYNAGQWTFAFNANDFDVIRPIEDVVYEIEATRIGQ